MGRKLPRIFGYRGGYPETTGTEGTADEKLVGKHTHEEAYALKVINSGRGLTAENPFTELSQPGADNVPNGTYYFNLSNGATTAYVDADGTYTDDSSNSITTRRFTHVCPSGHRYGATFLMICHPDRRSLASMSTLLLRIGLS